MKGTVSYKIHNILTGKEFNAIHYQLYGNNEYYQLIKLTNIIDEYDNFEYKTGLNFNEFNFNGLKSCYFGGISFIFAKDITKWVKDNNTKLFYRQVIIPENSKVYIGEDHFITNKLFLGEKKNINLLGFSFNKNLNSSINKNEINFDITVQHLNCISYLIKQIREICAKFSQTQNKHSLNDMDNQIREVYLKVVRKNGQFLQYIKEQTEEICLEAVKQDGLALEFVKIQTYKICLEAIKQNIDALKFVENQNYRILFKRTYEM